MTHLTVEASNYILLDALIETGSEFKPNTRDGAGVHVLQLARGVLASLYDFNNDNIHQIGLIIFKTLLESDAVNPDARDRFISLVG